MLILLTIFLFLFIPLVMLILFLVRPKLNAQGFIAVLTVLVGWTMVFLARSEGAQVIPLPQWKPVSLFVLSPTLLIDQVSWFFSLAMASLALSVMITSIAQLGVSPQPGQSGDQPVNLPSENNSSQDGNRANNQPLTNSAMQSSTWQLWASMLALTSLGLLAVTAGNILTLLLAWTALDMIELVLLLTQLPQSAIRERVILAFSARMAGICLVLFAAISLSSQGSSLSFEAITLPVSTLLVVAAGLRLGVLPLHLPFTRGLPINRNLATALRIIPAAASYILLVRVSSIGVIGTLAPYLLGFTVLAGGYAALNWLRAKDELAGRPYWLLGMSSIVVAAAIIRQPVACLAWGIASMLSAGLIFSLSLRHKRLALLVVIAILNISTLPFSPTWQGVFIYQYHPDSGMSFPLFGIFSFLFFLIHVFLLAGFARHSLRGIFPVKEFASAHIERWVWSLYPLGLIVMVLTHLLIGWWMVPELPQVPLFAWIVGVISLPTAGIILYLVMLRLPIYRPTWDPGIRSAWDRFFSLDWLYGLLWRAYRTLTRTFGILSAALEGDGGLLWALVLFGLLFVFLQR